MKIIKKNGKRYLIYKGKKYRINSKASDNELSKEDVIYNLIKVINKLIKRKQKRRSKISAPINNTSKIEGSAMRTTLDNPEQAKNLNAQLSHNVKINSDKLEKQTELIEYNKKIKEEKEKYENEKDKNDKALVLLNQRKQELGDERKEIAKAYLKESAKFQILKENHNVLFERYDQLKKDYDYGDHQLKELLKRHNELITQYNVNEKILEKQIFDYNGLKQNYDALVLLNNNEKKEFFFFF